MLFAQQAGGPPPWLAGLGIAVLVGVCVFVIVIITVYVFFLMTLMNALKKCSPRNRKMEPGLVWLNLVPCLNVVWQFLTVVWVADSLKKEFESRGVRRESDYGKTLGLTSLVVNIAGGVVSNVMQNVNQQMAMAGAGVSILASVTWLVLFVMYWMRIAGYSRELTEGVEDGYEDDYDDRDRDDNEPRGRRDRDDDSGFDFRDRRDR